MLNAMREGAKSGILRFVFFGLMGLATFGLVLTDAGGFFGGGFGRQTVAKVGDIELTLPVFNNIYSRELSRNNIPPEVARNYGMPQMTLGREINRLALLQAANETGIRVSDAYVAKSIKGQLDQVGLEGNDEENLDYVLRQLNMSEGQLTRGTREDVSTSLVSAVTANTGKAMRPAIDALYKYQKEKRVAEIITVSPSDIKTIDPVTDEQISAFYQNNLVRFTTPEKRSITMLHVTTDAIGRDITIGDQTIADFYESNKSEYRQSDEYQFSQTIYNSQEAAQSGTDGQAVESDWYKVEALPVELSDAVKGAKAGDTVGPIETSLGFHVISLTDVKKDSYTPLADVKQDIKMILRDKEVDDQIYNLADDLDNAVADGLSLQELAKQYDIALKSIPALASADLTNAALPEKQNDALEIVETIFAIDPSEISPVIELSDGSFALVEVTQVKEEDVQPLAQVSSDIKAILTQQQKLAAVQTKATQIMAAFNKGEANMADLARQNNVSFSQPRAILRVPQDGVAISTKEAGLLFSLTPKNDISSLRVGSDVKIIRLANVQSAGNAPEGSPEIATLSQKVKEDLNSEMQQQFSNAWKEKLGVNVNMPLFQQAFLSVPEDDQ